MKAVIFDMDGVLINTEPLHYRCWKEILKEKNGIDLDYEVYLPCIGSYSGHEWRLCRASKTGTGYFPCNGRETGNGAGGLSGSRGFD